jgi:hypothetical protein
MVLCQLFGGWVVARVVGTKGNLWVVMFGGRRYTVGYVQDHTL